MKLLRILLLMLCTFLSGGCLKSDTVTTHYASRAEAEADGLFERGWLPAIIPASSRDITVSNDLDLNVSEGEFFGPPIEMVEFVRHLTGGEVSKQGHRRYSYADGDGSWTFLVDAKVGHCKYRMRLLDREG